MLSDYCLIISRKICAEAPQILLCLNQYITKSCSGLKLTSRCCVASKGVNGISSISSTSSSCSLNSIAAENTETKGVISNPNLVFTMGSSAITWDTSTWTPGSQSITFQAVEGNAQFTLNGKIPEAITEKEIIEIDKTIHALELVPLLVMSLDSMEILDERTYTITDQTIISYDALLQSKKDKLDSTSMEGKYNSLALEIVSEAEYLTSFGFYNDAIQLLETIPDSDYPAPPSTTTLFIIASVVLGLTTIVFALLFVRTRSSTSYLSSSVSEKADKLDLLLIKASRIDKSLADDLETIKRELKELV